MEKHLLFSVTAKDFEIQTFRSGGKGGQNQNKVNSGVRLIHRASGARGEARDSRHQHQNRLAAFQRLLATPEWRGWHAMEVARRTGAVARAKEALEATMVKGNLVVEGQDADGRWVRMVDEE